MASRKIRLNIVTPKRILYDKEVDMVILRSTEGDLGILSGHQEVTFALDFGLMRIDENGGDEIIAAVFGGFCEVTPNKITVLSDGAEWPDEIDEKRAEDAKERAERRINSQKHDINFYRAELALKRALTRIEAVHFNKK